MIDQPRLTQEITSRSPLTPDQFHSMLGGVEDSNKRLAWDILCLPKPAQSTLFLTWAKCSRYFPEAVIAGLKATR